MIRLVMIPTSLVAVFMARLPQTGHLVTPKLNICGGPDMYEKSYQGIFSRIPLFYGSALSKRWMFVFVTAFALLTVNYCPHANGEILGYQWTLKYGSKAASRLRTLRECYRKTITRSITGYRLFLNVARKTPDNLFGLAQQGLEGSRGCQSPSELVFIALYSTNLG